jgi:hypothetical protein
MVLCGLNFKRMPGELILARAKAPQILVGPNSKRGYSFDTPWKPQIMLQYDYASGDKNPTHAWYICPNTWQN